MRWILLAATLLLVLATPADAQVPPSQDCYPTSGGLDYQSYLCYDIKDPFCPVYTITHTDAGTRKHCIIG